MRFCGTFGGDVGIDQRVPEPALTFLPRLQLVFDEERAGDHPHAVMHKAGLPQLPHTGIDNGITGLPALPRGEPLWILIPGEKAEFWVKGLVGH